MKILVQMKNQSVDVFSKKQNPTHKYELKNVGKCKKIFNSFYLTTIPAETPFLDAYHHILKIMAQWGYKTPVETEVFEDFIESDEQIDLQRYHDVKLVRDIDRKIWTFYLMTYNEHTIWEDIER